MMGDRFIDRFPAQQGQALWCATCGATCAAEDLDWSQDCPTCAQWWRDNPPPAAASGALVPCVGCGLPISVAPGPDMPEDGSAYRRWRCLCGLEYDLGRQDGQGFIFLLPHSVANQGGDDGR
jgi:hypothetical protein